ncbi:NADPH-dependent glutamate synthase beta chain or related oxidoreductase [Dehalogenimonas formicexedens]|uniref:NADPH-dependent glutamate synthase beta chain or related oxidoreductase n=1 Tax=Dehalogenimonas formicexedens TaxID=1839801 RepID=A0A1P8FAJ4_9CHLR|nr:FAD-dependent oxidoreductase [Dehalogenimonas formicexedens]APV45486.1 NADPH-dependent glutamate synthase beta chain or related oxidoreductase [Dehalogenimonas formicexedens]
MDASPLAAPEETELAKIDNRNIVIVPEQAVSRGKQTFGAHQEFKWSEAKCTSCDRCNRACPVDAITLERTRQLKKRMRTAPCSQACPAGLDASRYIRFIAEGKYAEAVSVMRERVPFPLVLGYICKHPCESACQRNEYEGSLLIRALKRFAAEKDDGSWRQKLNLAAPTGKKIAVIGSGPAGLSTAYYLALLGHKVTIFEALPDKGGKMLSSIPEYQLPKNVMNLEISTIESFGVEIKTNSRVESVESLFGQGFDSAVLATGILGWGKSLKLPIPGSRDAGVSDGETIMADLDAGKPVEFGQKVIILGGGSLAFRLATAAARSGAKEVHIFGQEHTGDREADSFEVDEAVAEGVIVHSSSLFYRVYSENGKAAGILGQKIRAFGYDRTGALGYDPLPNTEEKYPADIVISALGRAGDTPQGDLEVCRRGVFAAGDAVNEQRSVVESIAAGRWTASMADRYLGGSGNLDQQLAPPESSRAITPIRSLLRRMPSPIPVKQVRAADGSQAASEQTLDEKAAKLDAERCLKCDLCYDLKGYNLDTNACVFCGRCVEACMWNAITPGTGYTTAVEARQGIEHAESAGQAGKRKVYLYALRILVATGALMVIAVLLSKINA